jgi:hypothetical protein
VYSPKERRGSKICVLRLKRRRLSFFLFFLCSTLSYILGNITVVTVYVGRLPYTCSGYRFRSSFCETLSEIRSAKTSRRPTRTGAAGLSSRQNEG